MERPFRNQSIANLLTLSHALTPFNWGYTTESRLSQIISRVLKSGLVERALDQAQTRPRCITVVACFHRYGDGVGAEDLLLVPTGRL